MKIRSVAAGFVVAGLLVMGVAGPAQAGKPTEKVAPYAQHFSFDTSDCGLELHYESDVSGKSSIHPVPGSTEAFLFHDSYQFAETITLVSDPDGPFVTTEAHGNFHETHGVLLNPAEPTIYEFTSLDASRFRMFDSRGAEILSGSGVFKSTAIFDTLGDGVPGAQFIEETSGIEHGHQTGGFCDALVGALT